ncbi:hypothetical protein H5410_052576 [Solanum commersonii]|uniref:Uncharacterized protein n=1 Tax=Solanum commersonii TaxID=4109 RepID=A0A9J5X3F6_SOLCO|nr:hypothetical protein H5410_052576 [Solanum commersonii]
MKAVKKERKASESVKRPQPVKTRRVSISQPRGRTRDCSCCCNSVVERDVEEGDKEEQSTAPTIFRALTP